MPIIEATIQQFVKHLHPGAEPLDSESELPLTIVINPGLETASLLDLSIRSLQPKNVFEFGIRIVIP